MSQMETVLLQHQNHQKQNTDAYCRINYKNVRIRILFYDIRDGITNRRTLLNEHFILYVYIKKFLHDKFVFESTFRCSLLTKYRHVSMYLSITRKNMMECSKYKNLTNNSQVLLIDFVCNFVFIFDSAKRNVN